MNKENRIGPTLTTLNAEYFLFSPTLYATFTHCVWPIPGPGRCRLPLTACRSPVVALLVFWSRAWAWAFGLHFDLPFLVKQRAARATNYTAYGHPDIRHSTSIPCTQRRRQYATPSRLGRNLSLMGVFLQVAAFLYFLFSVLMGYFVCVTWVNDF